MRILKSNVECAMCGNISRQTVVLSSHKYKGDMRLDSRIPEDAFKYRIQRCPHCNYVNNEISKRIGIAKEDLKTPEYEKFLNLKVDNIAKNFMLSAVLFKQLNKQKESAMQYLKASWVFDDLNKEEYAEVCREKACELLLPYAETEDDGDECLLCIDLYRKNRKFEKALELIARVDDTGIESIDQLVEFQKNLISKRDSDEHFASEVDEDFLERLKNDFKGRLMN